MAQAVSCWHLSAEARVHAWVSPCGICGGQIGTGTGFSLAFQFSSGSIIPLWLSILIYHLRMNKRPVTSHSSQNSSHSININDIHKGIIAEVKTYPIEVNAKLLVLNLSYEPQILILRIS
jgi:hypothetical protein